VRGPLLSILLLSACSDGGAAAPEPQSACRAQMFEESRFTVCDPGEGRLELFAAGRGEAELRQFADLEASLGGRAGHVAFAMNAGMYDEDGRPIGLAIVEGRQKHSINRRKGGGNFHLMPNGVFQVHKDGRAEVVTSGEWKPSPTIRLATQSGPMLVIDGKIHPAFIENSTDRKDRDGVGVDASGKVHFVITEDRVNFHGFARFFRDGLGCPNALFLDGGSAPGIYAPELGRDDAPGHGGYGPIIGVVK
jgi:uncharacterized protein YigE (DUF2233 family)